MIHSRHLDLIVFQYLDDPNYGLLGYNPIAYLVTIDDARWLLDETGAEIEILGALQYFAQAHLKFGSLERLARAIKIHIERVRSRNQDLVKRRAATRDLVPKIGPNTNNGRETFTLTFYPRKVTDQAVDGLPVSEAEPISPTTSNPSTDTEKHPSQIVIPHPPRSRILSPSTVPSISQSSPLFFADHAHQVQPPKHQPPRSLPSTKTQQMHFLAFPNNTGSEPRRLSYSSQDNYLENLLQRPKEDKKQPEKEAPLTEHEKERLRQERFMAKRMKRVSLLEVDMGEREVEFLKFVGKSATAIAQKETHSASGPAEPVESLEGKHEAAVPEKAATTTETVHKPAELGTPAFSASDPTDVPAKSTTTANADPSAPAADNLADLNQMARSGIGTGSLFASMIAALQN